MMRARKRFGQHFLQPAWADKLVDVIAPAREDVFLEIGPGRGVLTSVLARRAARVIAVEIDRDLAASLQQSAPPNVTILTGDVLELDLARILEEHAPGARIRVTGNLPYYISSPILFRLLQLHREGARLSDATLMLQREVVDRLTANPGTGEYGTLTVLVRLDADVERRLTLPPGAFRPVPKVWSAVVSVRFRAPAVGVTDPRRFERMLKALFGARRKTLLNGIKPLVRPDTSPRAVLAAAGIDAQRRPETLDLAELAALYELLARS
jgi:16S rRNA (adenine1518-N6/adenine1519-N6)-dimethyltransferase